MKLFILFLVSSVLYVSFAENNINMTFEEFQEFKKTDAYKEHNRKIKSKNDQLKNYQEEEKNRIRNLNNTGIWSVRFYVDEFQEATKDKYITNTKKIRGTFSNTATQNSKLDVKFLITNSSKISIQLFEYAGNNPVKGYSRDKYKILMQDRYGKRYKLYAKNYFNRLSCDNTDSKKIHKVLMKGGNIKFKIIDINTPTTEYVFSIADADWYSNAYRKLK